MTATLLERVDNLEKELKALKAEVAGKVVKKDWRTTFGSAKNDPGFDEMIRLGREYRERQREDYDADEGAGA